MMLGWREAKLRGTKSKQERGGRSKQSGWVNSSSGVGWMALYLLLLNLEVLYCGRFLTVLVWRGVASLSSHDDARCQGELQVLNLAPAGALRLPGMGFRGSTSALKFALQWPLWVSAEGLQGMRGSAVLVVTSTVRAFRGTRYYVRPLVNSWMDILVWTGLGQVQNILVDVVLLLLFPLVRTTA